MRIFLFSFLILLSTATAFGSQLVCDYAQVTGTQTGDLVSVKLFRIGMFKVDLETLTPNGVTHSAELGGVQFKVHGPASSSLNGMVYVVVSNDAAESSSSGLATLTDSTKTINTGLTSKLPNSDIIYSDISCYIKK